MKKAVKKKNNHPLILKPKTFGQKAADKLTKWAGSWAFIITFAVALILWIILNSSWLVFGKSWDPKPYILLNLVLSCLAAIQAPIILMSQNRESQKDRARAQYDYAVDRKAERENLKMMEQLDRIEKYLKKRK